MNDWFEAFTAHPRIGDVSELAKKFASTADLCSNEQSAAMESAAGNKEVLAELKEWNDKYFDKNGFIFIIFATGKTVSPTDRRTGRPGAKRSGGRWLAATRPLPFSHCRRSTLSTRKKG